MSHDIRTPMNAIIGFTSLAITHMDNREQLQDYLKKICISSEHLMSLINWEFARSGPLPARRLSSVPTWQSTRMIPSRYTSLTG